MDEVYLEITPEIFEKIKKDSIKDFKKKYPNDESSNYWFPHLDFECCEDVFKNGYLTLSGDLKNNEDNLGYISIKMKMDHDRVIEIINDYMKKLGKIKTVLEATKDVD